MKVAVRRINEWDGPAMLKIYAPYTETLAAPEEALPPLAEYVRRIDKYTYGLGWLMCEIDSTPAGFCLLTENTDEPENPFSLDLQLYVKETYQCCGVGTALVTLMADIMSYGNRREIVSRIMLPNAAAASFFEKNGFEKKEVRKGAAEKFGEKQDLLVVRRVLKPEDPQAELPTKPYLILNADYEAARGKAALLVQTEKLSLF